ncbi:hypothetical protein R7Q39_27915 [Vibrio sp. 947]|uniref:hypothetical protein n=1 Tax=unclassified Vibrio TaxID=2614977 RepID=UPI002963CA7D|nr:MULTISPECIES: hypothetical protein [unclassified Vibrio]MDW1584412.1 hypothetical protein [Vibrio sp. Vb2897]MDW1642660.1 hypothetical protein [Vibrio sp. Vb2896]MDW1929212.1 hypothetical protein [Vibrio sp. 947]
MFTVDPDQFENRILAGFDLSPIHDCNQGAGAIFFLGHDIPDLFSEYLESLRTHKNTLITRPKVIELVHHILSFYMDENGKLSETRFAYKEVKRDALNILEQFKKGELFAILFNLEEIPKEISEDMVYELFIKDGVVDLKFPLFMTKYFMEESLLYNVINNADYPVGDCEDIEGWIAEHSYLPLLLHKDKLKPKLIQIMELGKYGEYGFLSELEQATRTFGSSFNDEYLYDNKLDGKNLTEAAVELVMEIGLDELLKLPCDECWEEGAENPVQFQNYTSITMLLNSYLNKRRVKDKLQLEDVFITDIANYAIQNSTKPSSETLLDRNYLPEIVKKTAELLDQYEGEPLHFSTRFINSYISVRGNADLLKDNEKFIANWFSRWSDEEIDGWESFINKRTRLRLNEKFTLEDSLDKEDYYKLVLLFGKDEVDSKQFAEFCNEHKSDIFVEHDGERFRHFDIVHSGGIQFLLSRYK